MFLDHHLAARWTRKAFQLNYFKPCAQIQSSILLSLTQTKCLHSFSLVKLRSLCPICLLCNKFYSWLLHTVQTSKTEETRMRNDKSIDRVYYWTGKTGIHINQFKVASSRKLGTVFCGLGKWNQKIVARLVLNALNQVWSSLSFLV